MWAELFRRTGWVFCVLALNAGVASAKQPWVDVASLIPDLVLDLRYSTPRNFLGHAVYPKNARCLLRPEAADKLEAAARLLREGGFRILVYDCYRPLSVQKEMWKLFPHRGYVANPRYGGQHNRGTAVDVGLAGTDGFSVEMPTDFDTFTKAAHQAYAGGSEISRRHRAILREAMERAGFEPIRMEWWHYALPHSSRYALLNAPLAQPEP
jgi:zinc D-Ala-D-Ala dipeptidase